MGHGYTDTMIDAGFACFNHPRLRPDAWHQLDSSKPVAAGAQAALVCRFSCPAGQEGRCPFTDGTETICGAGWYDRQSNLRPFRSNEIEANQAAAYVGLTTGAFLYLARYHEIRIVRKEKHLRFFDLEQVKRVARTAGPACGSVAKLALHEIRGDAPCHQCHGAKS